MDVIELTQKLIRFNTINPPGNEKEIAEFCGKLLKENGFDVRYYTYKENRVNVIAEIGVTKNSYPIVLSGHLDVVPLGQKEWSVEPFAGKIIDGKLYGRGATDMKGGVAAIISAAIKSTKTSIPKDGVRIILSASEEDGCKGISHLANSDADFGNARGIIVAEPTNNFPVCAHKGALYMWVKTFGVTAHSSMPEKGINAIYKAARAITKIEEFNFNVKNDNVLGLPTINVGVIKGGLNLNSVPDSASFSIDIRSTRNINHQLIIKKLQTLLGNDFTIEVMVDKNPVFTDENNSFVKMVDRVVNINRSNHEVPKALPYFTDSSVLQEKYNGTPTIIFGPGEPKMAHQTDEYCEIGSIKKAEKDFYKIIMEKNV